MQVLESDKSVVDANWVTFERRSIKNEFKSRELKHPFFEERDYVIIQPPGNNLLRIETPVTEAHKQSYPRLWANFQNAMNNKPISNGTPLEHWPQLTKAQCDTLKGMQFHTVEQIAGASDLQAQQLQMVGSNFRKMAQDYLNTAAKTAETERIEAEKKALEEQNAKLQASISDLTEKVAALTQLVQVPQEPKPKRKYTKRVKEDHVE